MTHRLSMLAHQSNAKLGWTTLAGSLRMLDLYDWQELIDARDRADSIGHIIDPTGYRSLIHNNDAERNLKLAKALVAFLSAARETHPEIFDVMEATR